MGELAGLASAVVWATTNIVLRGQSVRLGAVSVNAWRAIFAALTFFAVFLLTRRPGDLLAVGPVPLMALLAAVFVGMVSGDALQFTAMTRIGVSRAMPIGACFPLFTVAIAALVLHERITPRTLLGALPIRPAISASSIPSAFGLSTSLSRGAGRAVNCSTCAKA